MDSLKELYNIIIDRKINPKEGSYTNKLLDDKEKVYRKVNEETYELIYAALKEGKDEIIYEAADLFYHTLVLLAKHDVTFEEVLEELAKRHK